MDVRCRRRRTVPGGAGNSSLPWRHGSKDRHRLGSFWVPNGVTSRLDRPARAPTDSRPEGVPRSPILQLEDMPELARSRPDNLWCRGFHADLAGGTHLEREPTPVAE